MSSQFYRVETFSLQAKKGWSASDVINEVTRQPGHFSRSIQNPSYSLLSGQDPSSAFQYLTSRLENAMQKNGKSLRKLRKDASVLMSIVVSFPFSNEDLDKDNNRDKYEEWISLSKKYFEDLYGKNLMSIVEHTDESHPHLHILVHGDFDKDNCYSIKNQHIGKLLESQCNNRKKKKSFETGLKSMQDHFYQNVSSKVDQSRLSNNPRQRLNRADYINSSGLYVISKMHRDLTSSQQENESLKKQNEVAKNHIKRLQNQLSMI